ncbi:hypothetical protein E6H18_05570 [Candidatus Bathyarchaeota archaeon]|nr:MAG: hypothetical protein E6H18_05570 [Candidatus Bathyarchaeota archaeon]
MCLVGAVAGFYLYDRFRPSPGSASSSTCVDSSTISNHVYNPDRLQIVNSCITADLVVEIICVTTPSQTDAIPACQNYTNQIPVPSAGQHITITGPYVLDTDHYNWAEIHPVYSLVVG